MNKDLVINGTRIAPGEKAFLKLDIARLPSYTKINLHVNVYRSEHPGPVMLVMGGVHGDEINGVEIVRRTVKSQLFENLSRGTVIVIPLLNIYGFINFSRETPDGKDVNRSFPGNMNGSLSSRVARTLTMKILPFVDFGVDFHTGGSSRYNYPQIRFTGADSKAEELAKQFGAPYLIRSSPVPKTLRKIAHGMKKPILVFEGGESLRLDGYSIQKGIKGLKRLMKAQGMIEDAPAKEERVMMINKRSWVRATQAGLFRWSQQSGAKVSIGETLGVINDPYGQEEQVVVSNKEGYIIGHNNAPVVSHGEALFHLGYEANVLE